MYSQKIGEKYSRISAFGDLWGVVIHRNSELCPTPVNAISHGGPLFQWDLNALRMAPFRPTVGTSFVPYKLNELYSKCLQTLHQHGVCKQCSNSTLCDWKGDLDGSVSLFQHWEQVVKDFLSSKSPARLSQAYRRVRKGGGSFGKCDRGYRISLWWLASF